MKEAIKKHLPAFEVHQMKREDHFILKVKKEEGKSEQGTTLSHFIAQLKEIYGKDGLVLRLFKRKKDSAGNTSFFYHQYSKDVRLRPGSLTLYLNSKGEVIYSKVKLQRPPKLPSVKLGIDRAIGKLTRDKESKVLNKPTLEYIEAKKKKFLCWNILLSNQKIGIKGYYVDATNGKIIGYYDDRDEIGTTTTGIGINPDDETAVTPARTINAEDSGGNLQLQDSTRSVNIEVYDMDGSTDTDGVYDLCEDDDGDGTFNDITNAPRKESNRPEVDALHNTGIVADYYARNRTVNGITLFNRDGWAGDGSEDWINYVHHDVDSQSSFYSRSRRKIFHGDGDGTNLSYKPGLDTSAHEWNHAVQANEITGGTNPDGGFDSGNDETFVIKESLSDVFAGFTNKDGGWRMGEYLSDDIAMAAATFGNTGSRYRSLKTPSISDSPDHYFTDACTLAYGWSGTTSNYRRIGILNKATYLSAMGGSHPENATDPVAFPPIQVIGLGVTKVENIYYYALTMLMDPDETLQEYREDIILACETLYPADDCCCKQVKSSFDAVGLYEGGALTPPAIPNGPNLEITPWGAKNGSAPYWQSPDVYVKDGGGIQITPEKGIINNLCAIVTNIGDIDAMGVSVDFYYSPYGLGYHHDDFFHIGTTGIDVLAGANIEACIDWDLTDLTFDYGGIWPFPINDFNHFCIEVVISHPDDIDLCNNETQHNFTDVELSDSDGDGILFQFQISNPLLNQNIVQTLIVDKVLDPSIRLMESNANNISLRLKDLCKLDCLTLADLPTDGRVFSLKPREKLFMETKLEKKSTGYNGPVKGKVRAKVESKGMSGTLIGELCEISIKRTKKENRFIAMAEGTLNVSDKRKIAMKFRLSGSIEHVTGKFKGRIKMLMASTGKQYYGVAEGKIHAYGYVEYSVHNMKTEPQGISFTINVVRASFGEHD